jgi:hypothetical protein
MVLETMTYDQLYALGEQIGVLLDDKPSMPVLKTRIRRSAI